MKYTSILFDLDRTLWDFDKNSVVTIEEIFYKYKLNEFCKFDDFLRTYRKVNENLWAKYRKNEITKEFLSWQRFYQSMTFYNRKEESIAKLMSKDYISISPTKTEMFPYTIEILEYLKSRYKLYIITNGFEEVQYLKLQNCGISKYFDHIFISEEIGYNKPNPKYFEFVLDSISTQSQEAIVVGDDLEVDIKGASQLDIDTVWFNPKNKKTDFEPTYVIQSLKEIQEFL